MKNIITLFIVSVLLTGCANLQDVVKKEVVYVDRPLPFCPAPPVLPVVEFKVDLLTDDDVKDPGKVGQAYKHDMLLLRGQQRIYELILDQYKKTSQTFEEVSKQINQLYNK